MGLHGTYKFVSNTRLAARLRAATGMGWLEARIFLAGKTSLLCERIVSAKEKQKGGLLHDPIEDEPVLAQQVADAKRQAEAAFRSWVADCNTDYLRRGLPHLAEHPRGGCHFIWLETKKVLRQQYGIEWFSPTEMNPGTIFD